MKIQLDFRSGEPIYTQITDQIRAMMARGELLQGDQLPTVRQLATELRVNFNTVARAYRLLDEAGLISTQQGRGTYVWARASEHTALALRQETLQGVTRNFLRETRRLGFTPVEVEAAFQKELAAWQEEI